MNTTPPSSRRGAAPGPAELRAAIERIHAACVRADPDLRDAPPHPAARVGMVARFGAILRAFHRHLPPRRPLDGLEVGVGEGALVLALAEFLPDVRWQGVDIPRRHAGDPAAFDALMASRAIRIVEADLTEASIPHTDGSFEAVSFSEVLEHLPATGVMPTLRDIARVLRPGGVVVATSPNLVSLMNRLLLLAGRSPFHLPVSEDVHGCRTFPHIHLYTAPEFEALCRLAGLEPVGREHLTYLAYAFFGLRRLRNAALRFYLAAERLLGALAPALRDGWLVAARKP